MCWFVTSSCKQCHKHYSDSNVDRGQCSKVMNTSLLTFTSDCVAITVIFQKETKCMAVFEIIIKYVHQIVLFDCRLAIRLHITSNLVQM